MNVDRFVAGFALICCVATFARGLIHNGWVVAAVVIGFSIFWAYIDHKFLSNGVPPDPPTGGGII